MTANGIPDDGITHISLQDRSRYGDSGELDIDSQNSYRKNKDTLVWRINNARPHLL